VKRIISNLILLGWLWALALAASLELHAWAHGDDAGHHDHHCAVELIASGGCDVSGIAHPLVAAPSAFVLVALPLHDADVPVVFLLGGPLERGPPPAGS
jgi:hypothetical protein